MQITKIVVGKLQTNCYLLTKDDKCLIIDPGGDIDKIITSINNKELIGILITHYHFDHILALEDLIVKYNPIICDNSNFDLTLLKPFSFEILETKGHKDDSLTFYFKEQKAMFTGDFLFKGSIGRTDLEGGNDQQMINSLQKIIEYPDDITIFPGHGDITTLANEKQFNPYINF